MSSYKDRVSAHRRLTILRFLSEAKQYTSNVSILNDVCDGFGIASTRAEIMGDVHWLSENAMVTEHTTDGFTVVSITARGLDIASGDAQHEGVKRPRPGV